MAIKVATGDGGGALAGAAFAAGAGLRRNKVQDDQMKALERQKAMESQQDFTLQRDKNQFDQALTQDLFRSELKRDDITWEMDQTQRAEFNNLSKAYASAVSSGDFTEDELKVMSKDIQQKQMGLQPTPRIKEPPQFGHGKYVGEEYVAADGIPRVIDASGVPRVPAGWKPPEAKDDASRKRFAENVKMVDQGILEGTIILPQKETTVNGKKVMEDISGQELRDFKNQMIMERERQFQEYMKLSEPPVSGGATPNVPGPGRLPPSQFDNYMKPGFDQIGGAPVQATLPAPTAEVPPAADTAPSKRIFDPFKEKMPVQPKANPYSPESVKAYIAKGKFNNKQSSLLNGAAYRLNTYQAKIDAAEPGSQERVDLTIKRLEDYEYLKAQMGTAQ